MNRKEIYWRKRLGVAETEKTDMRNEALAIVPPASGWRLIARRKIPERTKSLRRRQRSRCSRPWRKLSQLRERKAALRRIDSARCAARQSSAVAAAAASEVTSAVEIIDDNDVVASWRKTLARMTELCDGNRGLADDLLMANRESAALYRRAVATACQREAQRVSHSVSPTSLGL